MFCCQIGIGLLASGHSTHCVSAKGRERWSGTFSTTEANPSSSFIMRKGQKETKDVRRDVRVMDGVSLPLFLKSWELPNLPKADTLGVFSNARLNNFSSEFCCC